MLTLAFGAIVFANSGSSATFQSEGGPIETAQVVLWGLAAVIAAGFTFPSRGTRQGWTNVMLLAISLAAIAREFDAHVMLNPEVMGPLGVRYRIDWWLDPSVNLALKSAWAAVSIFVAALFTLIVVKAKPRPLHELMSLDLPTWLFAAAGAFLFAGYVTDDLLGRGQFVNVSTSQSIEEILELVGAAWFLSCVIVRQIRRIQPPETWRARPA